MPRKGTTSPAAARRERFILHYSEHFNATQAALHAGYSPKTAGSQGSRLLKDVEIAEEIRRRREAHFKAADLSAASVLEVIRRNVHADIRSLYDAAGNLKPIHELTLEEATQIAGFEVVMKNAAAGDGKIDRVLKVKLKDQSRYVEMAAKHFALLVERVQHEVADEVLARLDAGRLANAKPKPSK